MAAGIAKSYFEDYFGPATLTGAFSTKRSRNKFLLDTPWSMEAKRFWNDGFVSIFSLFRDGRELAEKIETAQSLKSIDEQVKELSTIIKPYLQFVHGDNVCELTGFRLMDIWRYFRHTWTNPYQSVPGRNMLILVRDAATKHHAVIGIAALSSAPVASGVRDNLLGWTLEKVHNKVVNEKSTKIIRWLLDTINNSIDELYTEDLFDKIHGPLKRITEIKKPTKEIIDRLLEMAATDRQKHYRLVQQGDHKTRDDVAPTDDNHWKEQAETHLFKSKRENELASLLKARMILDQYFSEKITKKNIEKFIISKDCKDVVAKVVRKAKGDCVGTSIAELSVCGAIPPYNEILSAKLVAMLAASPEVLSEYKTRYGKQPSIIASSMAGKTIIRPADLVFINTTSLYGKRPNQYDRLSMACTEVINSAPGRMRYKYLGKTAGFGTFHFSEHTTRELSLLLTQGDNGQRVNSIFGEGVSPRLRKLRDGFCALKLLIEVSDQDNRLDQNGLTSMANLSNQLLMHDAKRDAYGIELVDNIQDYLLGIAKRPNYYLATKKSKDLTPRIVEWWIKRFVVNRIGRNEIAERIRQHRIVHPIHHGARVELPQMDVDQGILYEEI